MILACACLRCNLVLQVVDMVPIQEGEVHSYTLTSTGGPLTATLVWFDYPADVNAHASIVNDLDLRVTLPPAQPVSVAGANISSVASNSSFSPIADSVSEQNSVSLDSLTYLGNVGPGDAPDRTNTVERVAIPSVAAGVSFNVTVRAWAAQFASGECSFAGACLAQTAHVGQAR